MVAVGSGVGASVGLATGLLPLAKTFQSATVEVTASEARIIWTSSQRFFDLFGIEITFNYPRRYHHDSDLSWTGPGIYSNLPAEIELRSAQQHCSGGK